MYVGWIYLTLSVWAESEVFCGYTLEHLHVELKHGGLEDDVPFQLGDFRLHVNFPGCSFWVISSSSEKR